MSNYQYLVSYHSFYSNQRDIEHFTDDLSPFENYPKLDIIYESIPALLIEHPEIKTNSNVLIYIVNWGAGFGSAMTVFIQNAHYLKSLNPTIHCIPHFSENTSNFKYHDESKHNSFFLYFKYHTILNVNDYTIFMVRSTVLEQAPFFKSVYNMLTSSDSLENIYTSWFHDNFSLKLGENVKRIIEEFKKKYMFVLGIHVRSIAQKQAHDSDYMSNSIEARLKNVKKNMDEKYKDGYKVVVASDVTNYINLCKSIFGDIFYLSDIHRISNEGDSIPQLSSFTGFPLGKDIMEESFLLSLCDHVYVSNSNIPFIIKSLQPLISMEEY